MYLHSVALSLAEARAARRAGDAVEAALLKARARVEEKAGLAQLWISPTFNRH